MESKNKYLLFKVDNITFALNILEVHIVINSVDYNPIIEPPEYVIGLINYYGNIIPLIDFRKRFDLTNKEIELSDKFIICKSEDRFFAIIVDRVIDTVDADEIITNSKVWDNINSFQSVIKLKNDIVLLTDLKKIFLQKDNESIKNIIRTLGF